MANQIIPTFIINRRERTDRKKHILEEFSGRSEFNVTIVEAHEHAIGAIGLFRSIKQIVSNLVSEADDYILICEDDHQFTAHYSKEVLFSAIGQASEVKADFLAGGISWLDSTIPVAVGIYWVRAFTGTQFMIIFRSFFKTIASAEFTASPSTVSPVVDLSYSGNNELMGFKLCSLTMHKFFIYPFVSEQKDFGYSDVTGVSVVGVVEKLFDAAKVKVETAFKIQAFYKNISASRSVFTKDIQSAIPTYIINLPERTDRRAHILREFRGKNEFQFNIVEAYKHNIGPVGLWMTIRHIINIALTNNDAFVLICEDDHMFTKYYSKRYLFDAIAEAQMYGANILSGGAGYFGLAVPISEHAYWINPACSAQFIIIYKKFYKIILDAPYDNSVIPDIFLSEMTSNRLVTYPFISVQKDFGYSDATYFHNGISVTSLFDQCSKRLAEVQTARSMWNRSA